MPEAALCIDLSWAIVHAPMICDNNDMHVDLVRFFYHTSPVQAVMISLTDSSLVEYHKALGSLLRVTGTVECNYKYSSL